jgi:hypothetical protein
MQNLMSLGLFSIICPKVLPLPRVLNQSFTGCTTSHAKLSIYLMIRAVQEGAGMAHVVAKMFKGSTRILIHNPSKVWFLSIQN